MKLNILFSFILCLLVLPMINGQSLKVMPDGVIIPKADHTAIVQEENGQMVYDTVTRSVWYFNNTIWKEVGSDNLGNHTATIDLDMDDNSIINVSTPVDDNDAVNKAYVDLHEDADSDILNEIQSLSASTEGDTLYLSASNWLIVPGLSDANYIKDIDGNVYNEVTIGTQIWLAENLKTTRYNDGTPIPKIESATDWDDWTYSWNGSEYTDVYDAYCWYDNDSTTYAKFGALYNWGVADSIINGGKNACPVGYEVPTNAQLNTVMVFAGSYSGGGINIAGLHIKLPIGEFWDFTQVFPFGAPGDNASGFAAVGSGYRNSFGGTFQYNKQHNWLWSRTGGITKNIDTYRIRYDGVQVDYIPNRSGDDGCSIRCIKVDQP